MPMGSVTECILSVGGTSGVRVNRIVDRLLVSKDDKQVYNRDMLIGYELQGSWGCTRIGVQDLPIIIAILEADMEENGDVKEFCPDDVRY